MNIQVDTREKKKEWARIQSHFDSAGIKYFRSKLYVGDYMSLDNPYVVIDRKKDLLEVAGNVCQQHERFKAELLRANEQGIKLIILIEDGELQGMSDVYFWHNPRLDATEWKVVDGKAKKVQKYPKATEGTSLYRSLITIRDKYGVEFRFCSPDQTGYKIIEILKEQKNARIVK